MAKARSFYCHCRAALPNNTTKHLVNQIVIYRWKLLKVSKKGGRGRLAEMGGGWGLNGCEVLNEVAYMLTPLVTAEQDPFMLLKDKCKMSTADTVILLHQHLDWRLKVHIQNNKPLVYQRSTEED